MKHETKNEDHQTREDEVANLWCTWMSEIPTKLEKMEEHLLSNLPWEESPSSVKCLAWARGRRRRADL